MTWDYAVVFFLGFLILTCIGHCPIGSLSYSVRQYDLLAAIPNWLFFAPNPMTADTAIVVRTAHNVTDIEHCNWQVVPPPVSKQTFTKIIWNPSSRIAKVLSDEIQSLLTPHESEVVIELTTPYLCIMNLCCSSLCSTTADYFQFGVIKYTDHQGDCNIHGLLFVSKVHRTS